MSAVLEAVCVCGAGTGKRFCDFEDHHAYWDGPDRLPSITHIIKTCLPRTDGAPEAAIEGARLRGVYVDNAIATYLTTGNVTIPETVDVSWRSAIGQAIEWFDTERRGCLVEPQVRLYGDYEAGTTDFIIDMEEIVDLKATYEVAMKTMAPQLGGYGDLYAGPGVCEIMPVKLKLGILHANKRFKKAQFHELEFLESWKRWRIIRDYWRMLNER